jgi:hypothetical protein
VGPMTRLGQGMQGGASMEEAMGMLRDGHATADNKAPSLGRGLGLKMVVQKAAWKEGTLQTALFEPFEILRHSNQESYRKEKEKAGSPAWIRTKVYATTLSPMSYEPWFADRSWAPSLDTFRTFAAQLAV